MRIVKTLQLRLNKECQNLVFKYKVFKGQSTDVLPIKLPMNTKSYEIKHRMEKCMTRVWRTCVQFCNPALQLRQRVGHLSGGIFKFAQQRQRCAVQNQDFNSIHFNIGYALLIRLCIHRDFCICSLVCYIITYKTVVYLLEYCARNKQLKK